MGTLLEKELVYQIVGCAMAALNGIGHGLREKTYERGLVVGLNKAGLATDSQKVFPVFYLGEKIDEYIPDLLVEGRVIVDAKAVDQINDLHRSQMINYLRITKIPVGLIMNFSKPELEWERIVLETAKSTPPDLRG